MNTSRTLALALAGGHWSGLLSSVALVRASLANGDSAVTGINAPSHWLFGDRAAHAQGVSLRYTVLGLLTHQAAAYFWSTAFAGIRTRAGAEHHGPARIAAEAAAMTGLAAFVDLVVVPRRFTPGFEQRLTARRLTAIYVALGAGLLVAALRERGRESVPLRLRLF